MIFSGIVLTDRKGTALHLEHPPGEWNIEFSPLYMRHFISVLNCLISKPAMEKEFTAVNPSG